MPDTSNSNHMSMTQSAEPLDLSMASLPDKEEVPFGSFKNQELRIIGDAFLLRGDELLREGNIEKAARSFEESIRFDPEMSERALTGLATIYYQNGETQKGHEFSEKALKVEPRYTPAIRQFADNIQNDPERQRDLYNSIFKIIGPPEKFQDLSVEHYESKEERDAAFEVLSTTFIEVHLVLAKMEKEEGERDRALDHLRLIDIGSGSLHPEVLLALNGAIEREREEIQKFIKYF